MCYYVLGKNDQAAERETFLNFVWPYMCSLKNEDQKIPYALDSLCSSESIYVSFKLNKAVLQEL